MKTLFTALLWLPSFAFAQGAPTAIPQSMVKPQPVTFVAIQVLTPTGAVFAQLDASIILDMSGSVPILKTAPAAVVQKVEQVDKFKVATATQAFTMTKTPIAGETPKVFRNGVLMSLADDYTVSGLVVTFVSGQVIGAGDIVQIRYIPAS